MLTTIWTTSLAYLRSFFFSTVLAPCLVLRWGWTLYWFSAWFPSRILLSLRSAVIPIRESFNPWAIPRTIGFKSLIIEKIFFVQMFLFCIFFANSLSRPPSANLVASPSWCAVLLSVSRTWLSHETLRVLLEIRISAKLNSWTQSASQKSLPILPQPGRSYCRTEFKVRIIFKHNS